MDVLIGSGVGSIAVTVGISHKNFIRSARLGSLILRETRFPANSLRISRGAATATHKTTAETAAIDLSDPDWKIKYQRDFEERFNIPHITDVFPDAEAIRSTFCLKMRFVNLTFQEHTHDRHLRAKV